MTALPAAAAPPTIVVALTQTDGTGPFTAGDAPGDDSSATNGIVRVNDTITYAVEVATNIEDATGTSFSVELPQGQEINTLPGFCGAGSSITPVSLPAPQVPLTATSYRSLPRQTVTCVVGARQANSTRTYPLTVKVRSEVPNGVVMGPVTASATADEVVTPVQSNDVSTTASAVAKYDISKNGLGPDANTGEVGGPLYTKCPQDTTKSCLTFLFPLTIAASAAGAKGTSPATSPITLSDALDPRSLFPSLTPAQLALVEADPATYGATINCNQTQNLRTIPNAQGGGESSVRDSGTLSCTQPGGPGTSVDLTLTNTDTSLATYPTKTSGNVAIPANQALFVSKVLAVNVPEALVNDFGTSANNTKQVRYTNAFTNFKVTGLDGTVQTSADQPAFNDTRSGNFAGANGRGVAMGKTFAGEPGNPSNTGNPGTGSYIGGGVLSGPPGGWGATSGQIQVGNNQTVTSVLAISGTTANRPIDQSAIGCDVWDNSKLQLQSKNYRADSRFMQYIGAGRDTPVWLSGFYTGSSWLTQAQATPAALPDYTVKYSSGAFGPGAPTDCSTGTWYTDPADVPGNDPQLASQGIYTAVNKVRVWTEVPGPTAGSEAVSVDFSIGLRVVAGLPTGTIIPNYAGYLVSNQATLSEDAMLASTVRWSQSTYDAGTAPTNGNTGGLGSRLISAPNYARITKLVKGPGQNSFGSTPPATTGGDRVQYQLSPTLNSAAPGVTAQSPVTVEDCLPAGQVFDSASLTPQVVSVGSTPADATIAPCAAGQTYLRWELGPRTVNSPIDPIVLTVRITTGLASGTYDNTVVVSADGDLSSLALRSGSAQIKVDNPSGISLDKVALTPQIQVNRTGQSTDELARWQLTLTNNNSVNPLSNPDVIDVLPKQGVGGTDFDGSLAFTSADVVSGGASLQYTSAPTVSGDASDASNGATGSTTWCTAPARGTVVTGTGACPTAASDVTGVRIVRPGAFASGDSITVNISMTAIGDSAGDVFVNTSSARVAGQALLVGPTPAAVRVVGSSVGDFVWLDDPKTGVQDATSVGVPNFPVSVVGTDDLGNAVDVKTTTDNDGKYSVPNLRAGTYRVVFDPNGLTSNTTFTVRGAGTDDDVDSDADTLTGQTAQFTLAQNDVDNTWDAGLVTDRNFVIVIDKKVQSQSALDAQGDGTVTYSLTVNNTGTASGTYSLQDELKFGGDVTVRKASATTAQAGVTVNPAYDGVKDAQIVTNERIAGGASHVYTVTVGVRVASTITKDEQACRTVTTAKGGGFVNTAQLVVDNVTSTDKACAPVPTPPPSDGSTPPTSDDGDSTPPTSDDGDSSDTSDSNGMLPSAGGPALGILVGGLLLVAGGLILVRGRRQTPRRH